MTAVSSAPAQPAPPAWVLQARTHLWQYFFPEVFLELPSEAQPFNRGTICTYTHTSKQLPLVRRGGGIEGSNFHPFPSRKVWGESGDQHHHYLQHVLLTATLRPVSSVWHCLEQHKRPSVWKVQERKGRACGLVLQSKDWHRGWEVLRQRLIPSLLKLTGKLPWTPASFGSCLKHTEGNKAA